MKKELGFIFSTFCFIVGFFAFGYLFEGHTPRFSQSDASAAILILLLVVARLLWRQLILIQGIADKLGFNSARTERINALFKKLEDPIWFSTSGLTAEERKKIHEELDELTDSDWTQEPAKAGQMSLVLEHLQNITALLSPKDQPSAES